MLLKYTYLDLVRVRNQRTGQLPRKGTQGGFLSLEALVHVDIGVRLPLCISNSMSTNALEEVCV
jgi:hypothetical protein